MDSELNDTQAFAVLFAVMMMNVLDFNSSHSQSCKCRLSNSQTADSKEKSVTDTMLHKKIGSRPFFFFFFFFFLPAEFSPSSPSVESIISFNTGV